MTSCSIMAICQEFHLQALAKDFRCRFLAPLNRRDVDEQLVCEFEDKLGDCCIPVLTLDVKLTGKKAYKQDGIHVGEDFLRRGVRPKLVEIIKKNFC